MVSTRCPSPLGSLALRCQRERNATHWPVSAGRSSRRAKGTKPGSQCSSAARVSRVPCDVFHEEWSGGVTSATGAPGLPESGYSLTRLHLEFSLPTEAFPSELVERLRKRGFVRMHVDLFASAPPHRLPRSPGRHSAVNSRSTRSAYRSEPRSPLAKVPVSAATPARRDPTTVGDANLHPRDYDSGWK